MPAIIMVGTSPAFYKIPVTQTLSTHICQGTYPPEGTRVTYCYPLIPRPPCRLDEGMKPLDNRYEILRCYEAFKAVVGHEDCMSWYKNRAFQVSSCCGILLSNEA
jgi:hypothetical protein